LISFNVARNGLHGHIPPSLLQGPNVQDIDLSFNMLTGSVPGSLSPALDNLSLQHNHLNGSLPSDLCTVPCDLVNLNVQHNLLSGKLPENFENLTNLGTLDVSSNLMTGTLPARMQQLARLSTLKLSGNMLSGPLDVLFSLKKVRYIWADDNWFTGPLTLPALMYLGGQLLNVSNNLLSGPFSLLFSGTSDTLATIDASHNHLTGPIPAALNQVSLPLLILFEPPYFNCVKYIY
jgi:Leucine-rich repeat (LRR) protein